MAKENKTKATGASVESYLDAIESDDRQQDCRTLAKLMAKATGEKPKMWGPSIVGFGSIHYVYDSGREGDICLTGFSPRKPSLVLYIGSTLNDETLTSKLGKYTRGKGCLYIKKLDDVDRDVLRALVAKAVGDTARPVADRVGDALRDRCGDEVEWPALLGDVADQRDDVEGRLRVVVAVPVLAVARRRERRRVVDGARLLEPDPPRQRGREVRHIAIGRRHGGHHRG